MRRHVQIFFAVASVLAAALITSSVTQAEKAVAPFSNSSFIHVAARSAPQTPGRRRRSRRRAGTTQSSKTTTSGTQAQTTSPPTTQGPLSQVTYELPLRRPRAGEQQERGVLTDVACDARGVTFKITAGQRALRLWTPDLNRIHFATYTPDVSGEIICGVRRPANHVVVLFRPAKTPGAKSDGTPISVEFVPPNFELKK
jgi:hypothetical protein